MTTRPETLEKVYLQLTGDDEGRVCRDIPEEACDAQPENFLLHVGALAATKTGDGLADARLVLAWLLTTLGAPAWTVGLLVPIREAGALLPQLFAAGRIRSLPLRKRAWAIGSFVQGIAVVGMGLAALRLEGTALGITVVALLTIMALARSVCSVSYKDVLGKTVSKATRGTATGTASTVAAAAVFLFGVSLLLGWLPREPDVIAGILCLAGALWFVAAGLFVTLAERPGATEGGGNAIEVVREQIGLLGSDAQLRRFVIVRGLLIATALAPPYLLALSGGGGAGALGAFVVASSAAAFASTYLWGRLADVSSRRVLIRSAWGGAVALGAAAALGLAAPDVARAPGVLPGLLFVLMIAYQGVRLGRSTHVVDMADEDTRAAYTALSNTLVGGLLLLGGAFGVLASLLGEAVVLLAFAMLCVAAAFAARGLEEVQEADAGEATARG